MVYLLIGASVNQNPLCSATPNC